MASSSDVVPEWVWLCGQLAPIFSIVVFCAPIPTLRQVSRDQTVGNLPLLPYSSMIASTSLWVVYGILKSEPKIWSANGVGLVLGVYYFVTFTRFSPKESPTLPGSTLQHLQGISLIMGITTILAFSLTTMKAAEVIGIMGVVFCVVMFASPLAALKSVLATKSAKSIPLPFTLAAVANCFLWSVVGVMDMNDFNIYAPNLLGLFFGLVQLALKVIYKDQMDHRVTPPHSQHDSTSEPLLDAV